MLGTYEFSDFPITEERFGVKPGQHIPGQVIYQYLQEYTDEFDLLPIIRLQCKVQTAEMKETGQWDLTTLSSAVNHTTPKEGHILADKLILATGLTSEPFMPDWRAVQTSAPRYFTSKTSVVKQIQPTIRKTSSCSVPQSPPGTPAPPTQLWASRSIGSSGVPG
jgi:cation diffusion facilitator CzcD-associated flavoprotein CzcO